jgi:hypothetical protein
LLQFAFPANQTNVFSSHANIYKQFQQAANMLRVTDIGRNEHIAL